MYHIHGVDVVALGSVVVVGDDVGDNVGNTVVGACGFATSFGAPVHVILSKNHKPFHYFLHNTAGYIPATCISFYL